MTSRPESRPPSVVGGEGHATADAEAEKTPELSIVLPTRNEERGITECLEQIHSALGRMDLGAEIIVSDSSTDETPKIARDFGATIVTPTELGYGNAYKSAFERASGEYIVIGDADTTYDFRELPKLLGPLVRDEADLVLGSRFAGEIKSGAMPALHQYVGNPFLTAVLNFLFRPSVTDAHTGFRAIRRRSLERLDLQSEGMEFASEMIIEATEEDLRIEEVPITYHERVGEPTLESFRDGWRHLTFMVRKRLPLSSANGGAE